MDFRLDQDLRSYQWLVNACKLSFGLWLARILISGPGKGFHASKYRPFTKLNLILTKPKLN